MSQSFVAMQGILEVLGRSVSLKKVMHIAYGTMNTLDVQRA